MCGILYRCEICRRKFKRRFHLKTHHRVHSKEKPYECSVCGRRFSHKCSMNRHQVLHSISDDGLFFCEEPLCGKRYTSKDHLNTHVKAIHRNMKPYTCLICDQRFAYEHVYARHVARFHTAADAEKRRERNVVSSSNTCNSGRRYSDIIPRTESNLEGIAVPIAVDGYNPSSAIIQIMSCSLSYYDPPGELCATYEEFADDDRGADENKPNIASSASNLEDIAVPISVDGYNPSSAMIPITSCSLSCDPPGEMCATFEEFADDDQGGDEKKSNSIASLAAVFPIEESKDKQEKSIPMVIKQEDLNLSSENLHTVIKPED